MMDFAICHSTVAIGTVVTVSDGTPQPSEEAVLKLARWKSRNFTGTLVEKEEGKLVFQLPVSPSGQPVFTVTPEMGCSFAFPTPDAALAEVIALDKLEDAAEDMTKAEFSRFRRGLVIMMLWNEIQRLKLANATGNFATLTVDERQKQFPLISALAFTYNSTFVATATAAETKLWDQVRRMALAEAKLQKAEADVRAATTPEAKLAVVDQVTWSE